MHSNKYVPFDKVNKILTSTRDSLRLRRMYDASNDVELARLEVVGMERVTIDPQPETVVQQTTVMEKRIMPLVYGSIVGKEIYVCKNCGNKVRPGDKFCGFCGRRYVKHDPDE